MRDFIMLSPLLRWVTQSPVLGLYTFARDIVNGDGKIT